MNELETKQRIAQALARFTRGSLLENAIHLLNTLGYHSERQMVLSPNTFAGLAELHPPLAAMNQTKALVADWRSVDFLFQLTGDDLRQMSQGHFVFENGNRLDNQKYESYLFLAIELKQSDYSRSKLADLTREVNRFFAMPVMILFQYGGQLTVSIINRRLNKREQNKDVLEKVTLIKGIGCANPLRAHIEILFDLSLDQLQKDARFKNFEELHNAWQKVLDTSELNKRFYREVADWYFWAVKKVEFPAGAGADVDTRNATSVIRLITRLIFVWFLKEKGLVAQDLFDMGSLKKILNYTDPKGSTYYKAVLQNLFFATLNTEMGAGRRFRGKNKSGGMDAHHGIATVYRYENYFNDPAAALRLFADIPFLNGGLFECLDKREEKILVDGFSDDLRNQPIVPDELFFAGEQTVNLNDIYGDTRHSREKVRGLIHIFDSYKFTIEENTPLEEEIALDPELLGKVFENLLAAYNPETGSTARKQTGSFYTPREIVNYMVDEALIASLETKLAAALPDAVDIQPRLRHLLAYNQEPHRFNELEVEHLITALDEIKVLDPACGSGAFPMGVLHKLVFILSKLDPGNQRWKQRQIDKAAEIPDPSVREGVIEDIERSFNENELDYGRKLYLIENCIYGVDIQPIAVQIAKLRFFISLVVEQKIDRARPNFGIRPLPNLETKFVAANTLIGIERPQQMLLHNPLIDVKEAQLGNVRSSLFTAKTPATKRKYRELDRQLRTELADLLKKDGWGSAAAAQLAAWDPYDQNVSAGFFDPEWMFGVNSFDIVLANPPYIGEKGHKELFDIVKKSYLKEFYLGKMDYFYFFIHIALNFGCKNSIIAFITTNYYLTAFGAKKLREDIKTRSTVRSLINFNELKLFSNALGQHNMITILSKSIDKSHRANNCLVQRDVFFDEEILQRILEGYDDKTQYFNEICQEDLYDGPECYIRLDGNANPASENLISNILFKIMDNGKALGDICFVDAGLHPGVDRISKRIMDQFPELNFKLNEGVFILNPHEAKKFMGKPYLKPLYKSSDISRWFITENKYYILYSSPHDEIVDESFLKHLLKFRKVLEGVRITNNENIKSWKYLRRGVLNERIYTNIPKIVAPYRSKNNRFAYTNQFFYGSQDIYFITEKENGILLKYILALLNSKLYYFWLYYRGKRKGEMLELYQKPLAEVPIRIISQDQQRIYVEIVDRIMAVKRANPAADTSKLEADIDDLIYALYGLTIDEIATIEGRTVNVNAPLNE